MQKKALIVENSFSDYEVFERILTEMNYEVITTDKGLPIMSFTEAVEAIHKHRQINLALLDIDIEGEKNGIDLAGYILNNGYNIRLIFTTYFYTQEALTQLAFLGSDIPLIHKSKGSVDYNAFKFSIKNSALSKIPTHSRKFDNICLNAHAVNLNENIREQQLPAGIQAKEKIINKDEIAFLAAGKGDKYLVPDEYVLFISRNCDYGFLSRISMNKLLLDEVIDERFVRINNNICINLSFYIGRKDNTGSKFVITLKDLRIDFELSNTYKEQFIERLRLYGLTKE